MEAILLLANSAEQNGGMVSALGLGWSQTSSPTPPAALVLLLKVPWDQTNRQHRLVIDLVDSDGQPFIPPGSIEPLRILGDFEVGRPPGLPAGTPIDNAVVINIGPGLPLVPGASYQGRVEINDEMAASRSFLVRPSGNPAIYGFPPG